MKALAPLVCAATLVAGCTSAESDSRPGDAGASPTDSSTRDRSSPERDDASYDAPVFDTRPVPPPFPICPDAAPVEDFEAGACITREAAEAVCRERTLRFDSTDAGDPACGVSCVCGNCAPQQLLCLGHAGCRAIIECATETNCIGAGCVDPCASVYSANGGTAGTASQISGALSDCLLNTPCRRSCGPLLPSDAGGDAGDASDAGDAGDASSDGATDGAFDASPDASPRDGASDGGVDARD